MGYDYEADFNDAGRKWILDRIITLQNQKRDTSYRQIWQGSYDVILELEDAVSNIKIPKARIDEVVAMGLIEETEITKKGTRVSYKLPIYILTDVGRKFLESYDHLTKTSRI